MNLIHHVRRHLTHIHDVVTGKAPLGALRSPHWHALSKQVEKEVGCCEICTAKTGLNVHHIVPFHVNPALELVRSNLRVLCRRCHLTFAHLGTWKSWNVDLAADILAWAKKFATRPLLRQKLPFT